MSHLPLESSRIQTSIAQLIGEARKCAITPYCGGVLGCAAMSTIFCCVLAVGEALCRDELSEEERTKWLADGKLVTRFCQEMSDKQSWLVPPLCPESSSVGIDEVLKDTRNSLSHALAVPNRVMLQANRGSVRVQYNSHWQLLVLEFIKAVEETLADLTVRHPQLSFEAVVNEKKRGRGPLAVGVPRVPDGPFDTAATGDSKTWKGSSGQTVSVTLDQSPDCDD